MKRCVNGSLIFVKCDWLFVNCYRQNPIIMLYSLQACFETENIMNYLVDKIKSLNLKYML